MKRQHDKMSQSNSFLGVNSQNLAWQLGKTGAQAATVNPRS